MTGKWFKYVGSGEKGESIPGVGIVSDEPLQARDESHQQAIEDSGVYKATSAPKKAEAKADAPEGGK